MFGDEMDPSTLHPKLGWRVGIRACRMRSSAELGVRVEIRACRMRSCAELGVEGWDWGLRVGIRD